MVAAPESSASCRASGRSASEPLIETMRSPRRSPARSAGEPSATRRTSSPSRSGSPTARRMRRATWAGASAIPSRRGSSRVGSLRRSMAALVSGTARMSPPSRRTALRPMTRPSASVRGPPEDPRGSGAECSMAPATRRPRGPRTLRSALVTKPRVARSPRPPGSARAMTGAPSPGASSASVTAGASPVSSSRIATLLSRSAVKTTSSVRVPSASETDGAPRRIAWATVATRPGATTTPDPADQPRPRPTTDGPTRSATPAMVDCRSEIVVTPSLLKGSDPFRRVVTCDLQVTVADRPRNLDGMPRGAPPETPLDAALAAVGDRWTLLVVEALLDGPKRFGDLQTALPGIAPNILAARLRQLAERALVVATPYQERPPRFVYELTAAARELDGALQLLADWGARHRDAAWPESEAAFLSADLDDETLEL